MEVSADNRCFFCQRLNSLPAESVVITLTLVHLLISTAEQLIHLDVIQVPGKSASTGSVSETTTLSENFTSTAAAFDPGGSCDYKRHITELDVMVDVLRYSSLVISSLFVVEILLKLVYRRINFFKDPWQVIDLLIVFASLGLEITFFTLHNQMYCFNRHIEFTTYIIVLRLWRIPRTCHLSKKEYSAKMENEMLYLRKTTEEKEHRYRELKEHYQKHTKTIEMLTAELAQHRGMEESCATPTDVDQVNRGLKECNGDVKSRSASTIINDQFKYLDDHDKDTPKDITKTNQINGFIPNRIIADSPVEENGTEQPNVDTSNTGLESKREHSLANGSAKLNSDYGLKNSKSVDSFDTIDAPFRSEDVFLDSDSSSSPRHVYGGNMQVEVQIEPRHGRMLSSTSIDGDEEVILRKKTPSGAGLDNPGFAADEMDEDERRRLSVMAEFDGTKTYRSADGIPMTDL